VYLEAMKPIMQLDDSHAALKHAAQETLCVRAPLLAVWVC
jgi:hypothetical protein